MREESVYKQIYLVTFAHSFENSSSVHSRMEIDIIVDNTIRVISPVRRGTHIGKFTISTLYAIAYVLAKIYTRNSPRKG